MCATNHYFTHDTCLHLSFRLLLHNSKGFSLLQRNKYACVCVLCVWCAQHFFYIRREHTGRLRSEHIISISATSQAEREKKTKTATLVWCWSGYCVGFWFGWMGLFVLYQYLFGLTMRQREAHFSGSRKAVKILQYMINILKNCANPAMCSSFFILCCFKYKNVVEAQTYYSQYCSGQN